jgi:hypothetical protein
MSTDQPADYKTFRDALAPLVGDLKAFAEAIRAVGDRHGRMADAASPAMREIADEGRYAGPSGWTGPIRDTHSLCGLTVFAAADYVDHFAHAFTADYPSVYGHLVAARGALEGSVVAAWLNEAGIARDERVKRGLSEFLYSAVEEQRLGLDPQADAHVDTWLDRTSKLGWTATDHNGGPWRQGSRGNPKIDGVNRPATRRGIAELLVDDENAKIGEALWSRLSAVSHVTWWGLRWAFSDGDAVPSATPDAATVPITVSTTAVARQALCIVRALRKAAVAHVELMGWADDEWQAAAQEAQGVDDTIMRGLFRARGGGPGGGG